MTQTLTTKQLNAIAAGEFDACSVLDASVSMARELLANREAQPVGFYTTVSGRKGVIWHNGAPEDDTTIYTAPPAPAVLDNLAAAVNRLLDYDGTRGHFSAIRCSDAREEVERLLAQPVSQGYKLPADWRLDESTGAKILMYKDCSVIEDQQAEYVLSLIQAAAPEGGNG